MATSSILSPAPDTSKARAADLVGIYGVELSKCDDLLVMGFTFCNGQHIATRKEWLERRIAELEQVLRRQMKG